LQKLNIHCGVLRLFRHDKHRYCTAAVRLEQLVESVKQLKMTAGVAEHGWIRSVTNWQMKRLLHLLVFHLQVFHQSLYFVTSLMSNGLRHLRTEISRLAVLFLHLHNLSTHTNHKMHLLNTSSNTILKGIVIVHAMAWQSP